MYFGAFMQLLDLTHSLQVYNEAFYDLPCNRLLPRPMSSESYPESSCNLPQEETIQTAACESLYLIWPSTLDGFAVTTRKQ